MSRSKLFLLKLGGSLITDKSRPYTPRISIIDRLSREIKEAGLKEDKLVVGHGGGSFPHTSASKYKTHMGFIDENSKKGMAIVHLDALKLNMIIVESLLKTGLDVYPIHPSSISVAEDSTIKEIFLKTMEALLEKDIIPVVYGDVGIDVKKGCCILSTEEIFRSIALHFNEKYKPFIIMCEEVDGVYTDDPFKNPDATLIREINRKNYERVKIYLGGSKDVDVTGGMRHKVEKLFELSRLGIESIIINCKKKNNLKKALKGQKIIGTYIRY